MSTLLSEASIVEKLGICATKVQRFSSHVRCIELAQYTFNLHFVLAGIHYIDIVDSQLNLFLPNLLHVTQQVGVSSAISSAGWLVGNSVAKVN